MKNPFVAKNWGIGQILLIVWVVFSVVYVSSSLWTNGLNAVYKTGFQQGQMSGHNIAVTKIIELTQRTCATLPLEMGEGENRAPVVTLINLACVEKLREQEAAVAETSEDSVE